MNEQPILQPIKDKLNKYPLPNVPPSFGKSYTFPEDVSSLTSIQLGNWLFKLAGWKGYTLHQLAFEESDYLVMDEMFNTKLEMKMSVAVSDKRLVKEALRGKIMMEDKDLAAFKARCLEKYGAVVGLKRIVELYSMQLDVISREISRRGLDIKMMQKGIQNFAD
jgi:hypothetical protein